jgi:hypothetical protein
MSISNKRLFYDDLCQQSFINSTSSSIKKRLRILLVPSVPRGGTDYLHKFSLNHSISSDMNLNPKEIILDSSDRIMNKS